MTALPAILNPVPEDNEDVVSALETADIFWTKGDTDEALRWLKRAAETASDAGNDMRALAIARSAADLKSAPTVAEGPRMSRPPPPSAMPRPASSNVQTEPVESRRAPLPTATPATSGDGAGRSHSPSCTSKNAAAAASQQGARVDRASSAIITTADNAPSGWGAFGASGTGAKPINGTDARSNRGNACLFVSSASPRRERGGVSGARPVNSS